MLKEYYCSKGVDRLLLLKGELHPNQKLASFVLYLKIINTILKNNICISMQIVQGTKHGIEILVGQAVFKLWIKTVKILFWSITQELLGLLRF